MNDFLRCRPPWCLKQSFHALRILQDSPLVTDTVLKWCSDSVNDFSLAGLPLVALDLSDYIHVTDNGVYSIAHMTR